MPSMRATHNGAISETHEPDEINPFRLWKRFVHKRCVEQLYPPSARGLYDPAHEHDACGVGFVADIKGRRSHTIVRQALQVLINLEHRGAAAFKPRRRLILIRCRTRSSSGGGRPGWTLPIRRGTGRLIFLP